MPITQDRFLSVLDAATAILETQRLLHEVYRQNNGDALISRANSVIANSPDNAAREIVDELTNMLIVMKNILLEQARDNAQLLGRVMAEQNHFAKHKRANEKAAYYQREKRRNGAAHFVPERSESSPVVRQGTLLRDVSELATGLTPEMTKAWYSGPNAPTPPPNYNAETGTFTTIPERSESGQMPDHEVTVPRVDRYGTKRYLPPDEELNAPVSPSDKLL